MYKARWSLTQDLSYNNFFLQLLLPVFKIADEKVLFMVNACVQIEQAENRVKCRLCNCESYFQVHKNSELNALII